MKKHISLLPPLVSNEKHYFHMQSNMQSVCPVTCVDGTLMFKIQAKLSLQCIETIPSVSPLMSIFV